MAKIKDKVAHGWSFARRVFSLLCVWGLVWSLVTIGGLRVAFDYDDTLVFSTPAFRKAFDAAGIPFSPRFWEVVNQSYDLEKPKLVANAVAWAFKALGFKVTILAGRPPDGGEALKKEWRRLASQFVFVPDSLAKHLYLAKRRTVLYFGDSDSDVTEARKAGVPVLRVRRSPKSANKDDYHPGALRETVVPFSEH